MLEAPNKALNMSQIIDVLQVVYNHDSFLKEKQKLLCDVY